MKIEKKHDDLWIAPSKATTMSFFQLFQGCLNLLPEIIDVENIREVGRHIDMPISHGLPLL
jgi:hypothetical protein